MNIWNAAERRWADPANSSTLVTAPVCDGPTPNWGIRGDTYICT